MAVICASVEGPHAPHRGCPGRAAAETGNRHGWSATIDVTVDDPAVIMDAFVAFAAALRAEDPNAACRLFDSAGLSVLDL